MLLRPSPFSNLLPYLLTQVILSCGRVFSLQSLFLWFKILRNYLSMYLFVLSSKKHFVFTFFACSRSHKNETKYAFGDRYQVSILPFWLVQVMSLDGL